LSSLRIALVLGLVLHKLVWEVMRRRDGAPAQATDPSPSPRRRAVKAAKVLALAGLLVQTLFLSAFPIARQPMRVRVAGVAIYSLGLLMAILGRVQLGRNWANVEDAQVLPEQRLVTGGIYSRVRHPIYAGDLLLLLGLELALNSWLVVGVLAPLLVVLRRSRIEEALLARTFGDYEAYRGQTKRFIPYLY
jgi:protein-S-isoprenylcysteine O-methyltransferase Ste14